MCRPRERSPHREQLPRKRICTKACGETKCLETKFLKEGDSSSKSVSNNYVDYGRTLNRNIISAVYDHRADTVEVRECIVTNVDASRCYVARNNIPIDIRLHILKTNRSRFSTTAF